MRRRSTIAALTVVTAALLTLLVAPASAGAATAGSIVPVVSDSFNRPDGNGLGVADTGQSWSSDVGAAAIAGGRAALGGAYEVASVGSGLSDGVAEVTVASAGPEFWLVTRLSDSTNYWRFGRSGGGPYVLQQIVGNALGSPQVDVLATVTPENGDRLSCLLTSADLTCTVDGVPVTRTADTFNRSATRHGLAAFASPESSFDDFGVGTPVVDQGCTQGYGYWKTHSRFGPAPYDDTWAELPRGEWTTLGRSGLPYFAVLWMPPLGNGYFLLADQYIAAELNGLSGASVPEPVAAAMSEAKALFDTYSPLQLILPWSSKAIRARFVALAPVLAAYNQGVTGPGACAGNPVT